MSSLSLNRASKRARTQQPPLLNPLAMMMNPMAGMMMNHPNMATLMGQMGGMSDGNLAAQPLQDDDDVDEAPHNTGSSSAASVSSGQSGVAASTDSIVPQVPAVPAVNVPHDESVHERLADALITRSATYLKNIGRNRLSDCLERLHGTLDATFTAECTRNGLLVLIWVMTRVKPGVKISDLRDST